MKDKAKEEKQTQQKHPTKDPNIDSDQDWIKQNIYNL